MSLVTNMLSCPTLTASVDGRDQSDLPIFYLDVQTEIHVALAFVSIRVSFLNTKGAPIYGTVQTPTYYGKATVCDISRLDGAPRLKSAISLLLPSVEEN